jgi:uncharacterized heparinase superfamily protein
MLGQLLDEAWLRFRRRMLSTGAIRIRGPAPQRLLITPPDLRAGDPAIAQEIYSGVFHFAGRSIDVAGSNPFGHRAPNLHWLRELHAFGWLRHLAAAQGPLTASNAQALVRDWLEANPRPRRSPVWEPETASRRLIAWLCHSILIVDRADIKFYRLFLRSIGTHVRFLRQSAPVTEDGVPRLLLQIALAYAALCVQTPRNAIRAALRNLDTELAHQILPDGGHVSRNNTCLPEVAALLLPLRQSIARLGREPSRELISAIDRIMPAIRFHRMGDGNFARMNGIAATQRDLVLTVLRHDDTGAQISDQAPYSGYQRLAAGETIVIVDAGLPPQGELSTHAHAGCLSFEMSCGSAPIVINCGAPDNAGNRSEFVARTTPAHSTATLNDVSSCRFAVNGLAGTMLANRIIAGPRRVGLRRDQDEAGTILSMNHDGYLPGFGLVHHRSLRLSPDGRRLDGLDRFLGPDGRPRPKLGRDRAVIRFHLHPSVSPARTDSHEKVMLFAAGGIRLVFECHAAEPELEESIFFAATGGARRCSQIVLRISTTETAELSWSLTRAA